MRPQVSGAVAGGPKIVYVKLRPVARWPSTLIPSTASVFGRPDKDFQRSRHPVVWILRVFSGSGATGLNQTAEVVLQLQGRAGAKTRSGRPDRHGAVHRRCRRNGGHAHLFFARAPKQA